MANDATKNTIDVLLAEKRLFPPSEALKKTAHVKPDDYERLYRHSIAEPEKFWAAEASALDWTKKWDRVLEWDFNNPSVKWFAGGKLNASYNCIDRHLSGPLCDTTAIIWEGDDGQVKRYTYADVYREVTRFANVLKKLGAKKGDRVTIYLPMLPELAFAMLACARIGAVHSVVFGGFSSAALRDRINDCASNILITADEGLRGGKSVPIKANADKALEESPTINRVLVVRRTGASVPMKPGRDTALDDELKSPGVDKDCPSVEMDAEDPLFILYTSGSTGKPKGILHTTAGYLLFSALTFKWVFDYRPGEIYFCTADMGWVTGHSYIVYGPLASGATTLIFEGIPTHPGPDRFWEIIEKHRVNTFYTAPTAIRALMRHSKELVTRHDLSSLRLLGSVGEPINPEAWIWYHDVVGRGKLPIVDTWWQTETGGILISPLPGVTTLKPGSATRPLFGVLPRVVKDDGSPAAANEGGYLVIERPWPGMLRGMYGDANGARMKEVYFSRFPGKYFSGDGARVDEDGDFWVMGRIDDVVNVSGHRLGTAEVESALVSHEAVSEAAVVGAPHELKGECIHAYVVLKDGFQASEKLRDALGMHVRDEISPIAKPDVIRFATGLPKTRSGKIMRRILRKIASGNTNDLGDTSTLADPSVVDALLKEMK
jgi:acetyl-CoA synthetase